MKKDEEMTEKPSIGKHCPFCNKLTMVVVERDDMVNYLENRPMVQDAFPYLSADDREVIMTGICKGCFPK